MPLRLEFDIEAGNTLDQSHQSHKPVEFQNQLHQELAEHFPNALKQSGLLSGQQTRLLILQAVRSRSDHQEVVARHDLFIVLAFSSLETESR